MKANEEAEQPSVRRARRSTARSGEGATARSPGPRIITGLHHLIGQRVGNRVATSLISELRTSTVQRDPSVEEARRMLKAAELVVSRPMDVQSVIINRMSEADQRHRRAIWDLAKAVGRFEYGESGRTPIRGERIQFWARAATVRLQDVLEVARVEPSLQSRRTALLRTLTRIHDDAETDDGADGESEGQPAGRQMGRFRVYTSDPDTLRLSLMESGLDELPSHHQGVLDPIFVVPTLPGGRREGGGWFPREGREGSGVVGDWLGKQARTGVPDADIHNLVEPLGGGLIGITESRAKSNIADLGVVHEAAHVVDRYFGIVPEGATLADYAGIRYERDPTVEEYAAEAYARYFLRPNHIYREDDDELPEDAAFQPCPESPAQCNARLRRMVLAAPAFQ